MHQQIATFGGGSAQTAINPLVAFFVLFTCVAIFSLPRKYVVLPIFLATFLLPMGQVFVIGGLHFRMFRIVIIVAMARTLWKEVWSSRFRLNSIDKLFIYWILSSVVAFTLLWGESGAFINGMGTLLSAFGTFFVLRLVCRDAEDIDRTTKAFAIVCAIVAACMLCETFTTKNFFYVFGGVPEFTIIREGKLRAQGAFEHPILAGTFGATLLPLFMGLWWQNSKAKTIALIGIVSAGVIAVTSGSSTALGAGCAGAGAMFLWPLRKHLRKLRWGLAITLITLHLVMKAPVWALIGRFDVVGGSSGYHRYMLVDNFIRRFGEWWLVGVRDTDHWGWDMWDICNQYVDAGVKGGLVTLVFLIALIVFCFKRLGRARKAAQGDLTSQRRLWSLGATLLANLVGFLGIAYFDQTIVYWYALLAMISTATVVSSTSTRSRRDHAAVEPKEPDFSPALSPQPALHRFTYESGSLDAK
jgi:hypothetical protein